MVSIAVVVVRGLSPKQDGLDASDVSCATKAINTFYTAVSLMSALLYSLKVKHLMCIALEIHCFILLLAQMRKYEVVIC